MAASDPAGLRRDYGRSSLRRADLAADPVEQFRHWFQQAQDAALLEANAMVLGTSDGRRPSSRTVLLKAFDQRGFVFFTNYGSRKALDIDRCPATGEPAVPLVRPGATGGHPGPGLADQHR